MTKVFKAAIGLKQQTRQAVAGTMPRYCTVSAINGSLVQLTMDGDSEPGGWYPSVTMSNYAGLRGLLVPVQGGTAYFQPIGSSYPLGVHHYDKGDGVQIGPIDPSGVAVGATAFVAIGKLAVAGAPHAVAIGNVAVTGGTWAIAIGSASTANGQGAVAIGRQAEATADYTVAIGYVAKATSYGSVAIGYGADAGYAGTVYGEVAIGRGATAKFARSIAMGHGAVAQQHYDGVIKVNTLRVDPQNRAYTKLGLKRLDGTQVYIYVDNNNQVLANTSW